MASILIADDSLIIRRTLKNILNKTGHTVVGEAENGLQAIESYRRLQPDIMTMDINMPMMDGVEAVERIVNDYSEAKIIMISAVEDKIRVFEALEKGAKHYILKPFNEQAVVKIVELVLDYDRPDILTQDPNGQR